MLDDHAVEIGGELPDLSAENIEGFDNFGAAPEMGQILGVVFKVRKRGQIAGRNDIRRIQLEHLVIGNQQFVAVELFEKLPFQNAVVGTGVKCLDIVDAVQSAQIVLGDVAAGKPGGDDIPLEIEKTKFVEALQALPLEVVADKPLVQAAIGEYGPALKLIVCNQRINFLLGKRFGTFQIFFGDAIDVGGVNVAV
jgi:hypothetical protein